MFKGKLSMIREADHDFLENSELLMRIPSKIAWFLIIFDEFHKNFLLGLAVLGTFYNATLTLNPRGELSLDQTGMCHRRLKFTTLFWSGKLKSIPCSGTFLKAKLCIVLYCIYVINQMIQSFHVCSTRFVQNSFKFSITAIS